MSTYSDITTIEYLYNEDEISGKSYLFCVDNEIDTLLDIKKYIAELNECENVADDLLRLVDIIPNSQAVEDSFSMQEVYITNCIERYNCAIKECSVRTLNCLKDIKHTQNYPSVDFFKFLLDDGLFERMKHVRRAGQKTFEEIYQIAQFIRSNNCHELLNSYTKEPETHTIKSLSLDDEPLIRCLWPVVQESKNKYSVRCQNVIDRIFNEMDNSLIRLYNYFNSAEFDVFNVKNVGRKTIQELSDFVAILVNMIDSHIKNEGANSREYIIEAQLRTIVGLSNSHVDIIINSMTLLKRVPLFLLIDCLFKQDERNFTIISTCTRVYNGSKVNVDNAVDSLLLTRERIRQLRNKIFSDTLSSVDLWKQNFDFSYYKQYCETSCNKGDIYKEENVDFSDDFIDVVLSVLFKSDYTLIGDVQGAIMSFYDRNEALFIVPNNLENIYDFEKFLADIISRVNEKVYEDYLLDINHHMLSYFKNSIRFDFIEDIMGYIRLMLYEKFQLVIEDGGVCFTKNANRTIPELVEDILESNGNIMSLDEIYEVFNENHPNLTKNKDTLRSNIGRSERIMPISRSGNYALKEWEAKGIKTGTIRDLVYEYLQGFKTPQQLEDIESFVRQYRPSTDANSIYNNISLDTRGLFELLAINDRRYIAISSHEYGEEFVDIKDSKRGVKRRTFQESIDALYCFVLANNRFPFTSSSSDEEMRLGRFLGIIRSKRDNHNLTEEEVDILKVFEETHGNKEISNDQYKWNLRYEELEDYVISHNRLPASKDQPSLYTWLNKQKRHISNGQLRDSDANKIRNLLELVT